MEIDIQYGRGLQKLDVARDRLSAIVSPKNLPPDVQSVIRSLQTPTGFIDLESFLRGRKRILVVLNDNTRYTPTSMVLRNLILRDKDVVTLVATGTHRSPTRDELSGLLGGTNPPYGGKVAVHNSKDEGSLTPLGETSRGTKLMMNSNLFNADGIIAIGSVEPHYFAGFTGGRKFFLPALAGYRSVEMNHSLALDENSKILALNGNPVHEDFMDALQIFNRNEDIFSVQLVLNMKQEITYTSSGRIVNSFEDAVEHAKEVYTTKVKEKADIIIAITKPPLDLDLYQSHKSAENVKLALKEDGVLILVSKCADGIGNRAFYDLLAGGESAISKAKESKPFGCHKAVKFSELLKKAHFFAVTDLPPTILNSIGVQAFSSVQTALDEATRMKGAQSQVLVVDDAAVAVPVPEHA